MFPASKIALKLKLAGPPLGLEKSLYVYFEMMYFFLSDLLRTRRRNNNKRTHKSGQGGDPVHSEGLANV